MIFQIILFALFCFSFLAIYLMIDRAITLRNIAINQAEWNEYSKGMTKEQKINIFPEWLKEQKLKHGWRYLYIPKI